METTGRITPYLTISMLCASLFVAGCGLYVLWLVYHTRREQHQQRLLSLRAELDALDSLDPPTVRPGYLFDHSEAAADGQLANTCVECYIEWLQSGDHLPVTNDGKLPIYIMPDGKPTLCPDHLAGRGVLAKALLQRKESTR